MNYYVKIIGDALEYIEDRITQQITLKSIAKDFCFSEHHFSRLFKVITGYNLRQYIIGRKLAVAVNWLQTDKTSITDIAYNLGFEYPEVFSRAFKNNMGYRQMSIETVACSAGNPWELPRQLSGRL